ncbi:MAG: tRNA pseudouridine(55) synthase TruB [Alphaproteobacteria bacterium]
MGRRRRNGAPVHGWVILDKPTGMTSTTAVSAVRRLTGAAKAGHAGTLDPLATGVLPIALGEATKTLPYVVDGRKSYRFTLRWGIATDSDDSDGAPIGEAPGRPDRAAVEAVLPRFTGLVAQRPPIYSAIKVDGRRAYDMARQGETPELQLRTVRIDRLALVDLDGEQATFAVDCGPGTYMRALARDIAQAAGTLGHVIALRRLRVGPFAEADAISLDELDAVGQSPAVLEHLRSVATALDDIPALALTEPEAGRLRNGQAVSLLRKVDLQRIAGFSDGDTILATYQDMPVALTRYSAGEVKPLRVLNL